MLIAHCPLVIAYGCQMRLDKEIAATTGRGALSVWGTRTAQRGRAAETTHVFVTLSAPLTLTALAHRWGGISYRMVVITWPVITWHHMVYISFPFKRDLPT